MSRHPASFKLDNECPGGMFSHKTVEFFLNFFFKWASIGCLDSLLPSSFELPQAMYLSKSEVE